MTGYVVLPALTPQKCQALVVSHFSFCHSESAWRTHWRWTSQPKLPPACHPLVSWRSITRYYKLKASMEVTSVTSKGQVTIPKSVRQQLGIRQGSRIEYSVAVVCHCRTSRWKTATPWSRPCRSARRALTWPTPCTTPATAPAKACRRLMTRSLRAGRSAWTWHLRSRWWLELKLGTTHAALQCPL